MWGVVVLVVVAAVVVVLSTRLESRPQPAETVAVHVSDLAPAVYRKGAYRGQLVRVAYPLRLHPTADPLVWEFRPGSDGLPPTHRVKFTDPPHFPERMPVIVVGTVEGIEPDSVIRLNNVPGVVVIRGARVVPPTSP